MAAPIPLIHRPLREERLHWTLTFLAAFTLYALTASHTVGLEDDALFIGALHHFGVSHPPGYPLHTLLGGLFYHSLPLGSPAYKAHLFSALTAAGAVTVLHAITAVLLRNRLWSYTAALAFAASKTFWSQSIVAEVYTLNVLLFLLTLKLTLTLTATPDPQKQKHTAYKIALIGGLALANHHPLYLLSALGIVPLLWRHLPEKPRTLPLMALITLATPAPLYLWMTTRTHALIPANFYSAPITDLGQFWHYLLRQGYTDHDPHRTITLTDKLTHLQHLAIETAAQYTLPGLIIALIGLWTLTRTHRPIALTIILTILTTSIPLILLRHFQATEIHLAIFRVYHLVSYSLIGLLLALGLHQISRLRTTRVTEFTLTLAILAIALPLINNWPHNNRRTDDWIETLARKKLDGIEPAAILLLSRDHELPVGYLHHILGLRRDLQIHNIDGLIYNNLLYNSRTPVEQQTKALTRYLTTTHRPVYLSEPRPDLLPLPLTPVNFYHRLDRQNRRQIILTDATLQWLETNLTPIHTDPWKKLHHRRTILLLMPVILQLTRTQDRPRLNNIIHRARQSYPLIRAVDNLDQLDRGVMTNHTLNTERHWINTLDIPTLPHLDEKSRALLRTLKTRLNTQTQNNTQK